MIHSARIEIGLSLRREISGGFFHAKDEVKPYAEKTETPVSHDRLPESHG